MLTQSTESALLSLLACVIHKEQSLESARVSLATLPDFEPFTCFSSLDRFSQGFLTCADVLKFLRDKGVSVSEKDGFLMAKALDSNGDGRVTYHDFLRFVLPSSRVYLSTLVVERKVKRERLYGAVESHLFTLFHLLLVSTRDLEKSREFLLSKSDFNLLDGFRWLDELNLGYLSELALRRTLTKVGLEDSAKVLIACFDSDGDGKLGYLEYVDLVTPLRVLYRESGSVVKASPRPRSTTPSPEKSTCSTSTPISQLSSSPKKRTHSAQSFSLLAQLFKAQCDSDRTLELAKENLALMSDFTIAKVMRALKKVGNWVRLSEFTDGLKKLEIDAGEEDVFLLVGTMEVILSGKLKCGQVAEMLVPKQLDYAKLMSSRVAPTTAQFSLQDFASDTLKSLAAVLTAHLRTRKSIEAIKQSLSSNPDFHPSEAFNELDGERNGKIAIDQLHHALKRQGVFVTHKDLLSLFNVYDSNQDGTISYAEFVKAVTPRLAVKKHLPAELS